MSTRTARSKAPLHNFTMPEDLRWGNQRFLRCMKVNSDGRFSSPFRRFAFSAGLANAFYSDQRVDLPHQPRAAARDYGDRARGRDSSYESMHGSHIVGRRFRLVDDDADDGGIAATREKLLLDLQTAADKMKNAIFKNGGGEVTVAVTVSPPPPPAAEPIDGEVQRPWNLRTRRAACKTPVSKLICSPSSSSSSGDSAADACVPKSGSGFRESKPSADKSESVGSGHRKRDRAKFSVRLSKTEIEADYLELVGHKPPRRPKKRSKNVQRDLDGLFPGLGLTQITAERYKVKEGLH